MNGAETRAEDAAAAIRKIIASAPPLSDRMRGEIVEMLGADARPAEWDEPGPCVCGHTFGDHYPHGGTDEIRCSTCTCEWYVYRKGETS